MVVDSTFSQNCVGVHFWNLDEYLGPDTLIPTLVDPSWIHTHLSLKTISVGTDRKKVWATINLVKVRSANTAVDKY